jgi:two-component system cell cycle sensor histidine kinase/response regulator CckA
MGHDDFEQGAGEERRHYREMFLALPVPLLVLSEDFSIILANLAFRKAFGFEDPSAGRAVLAQVLPSDRLTDRIRGTYLRWSIEELEHRLTVLSGAASGEAFTHATFDLEVNGRPLRFKLTPIRGLDEDRRLKILLIAEDPGASGVAAAPSQWQVSSEVPAGIWQAEVATLAFTCVSHGAEALLGYPASHWIRTPGFFAERIHPEDRAAVLATYHAIIERGGEATAEFRAITSSGTTIWCRETIRRPHSESGTLVGVMSDFSRRKQLEGQLLRMERAQAVRAMASTLSHDLNNPLMIISGYAEEIRNALPEEHPLRRDAEQILAAAERISGLTGRLLEFTNEQARNPQRVDVAQVIKRVQEKLTAAEMQTGNPAWALADPNQLENAILAITSAATEHESVYPRIVITCGSEILSEYLPQATLRPGTYTVVTIQVDGAPSESSHAAALARAHAIIQRWGGDIAVIESSHATTYTIYLRPSAPEPSITETLGLGPGPGASPVVEPKTVLVVEDEARIRVLVEKILQRERYLVLEAGSAEEALSVASKHPGRIDLLLTDVILPGLTGRELTELMLSERPGLKVVYMSGYTDDENVRRGTIPPGSQFIQKPFTLGVLVRLVRAALES